MSKAKHTVSRYRVGSKNQYKGLVDHHKESIIVGEMEHKQAPKQEERQALLEQYNAVLTRIAEEGVKPIKKKSIDWDLMLMIPHLANQHFYAYLEMIGLPFKFDREDWTRKKPKDAGRSKPCFSAFVRYRRYVTSKTRFLGLKPHELAGVRLALDGLESLDLAESNAKGGNFEKAAVYIGRALPVATFVKIIEMEHSYQIGVVFQEENRIKSKSERTIELNKIYKRFAKKYASGVEPQELWESFEEALQDEIEDDGTATFEVLTFENSTKISKENWYVKVLIEKKKVEKTITFETFRKNLNRWKHISKK